MNVAEIKNALLNEEFTVNELAEVTELAENLAEGAESRFAKLFELDDTVRLESGEIATVCRRNVHTVTVAVRGEDGTRKVTPSDIVEILEAGDPDEFDYFEYFGPGTEA